MKSTQDLQELESSTLLQPSLHLLFDRIVGERLACMGLLKAALNLGKEHKALHRIVVGGVFGQSSNSLKKLLLGRHNIPEFVWAAARTR